jgi:hypothetical protein
MAKRRAGALPIAVAVLLSFCAAPASAAVTTLGFDDIDNPLSKRVSLEGVNGAYGGVYGGLVWEGASPGSLGWQVQDYGFYNGAFTNALTVAPPVVRPQHVVNVGPGSDRGQQVSVRSDVPFFLQEIYLAPFGRLGKPAIAETATEVLIRGLDASGAEVHRQGVTLLDPGADPFATLKAVALNWTSPVLMVEFVPTTLNAAGSPVVGSGIFLADSLSVRLVPLPAGLVLLGSALGVLGFLRRT